MYDAQVMFAFASSSMEFVKMGKLRALGVTTTTHLPMLPDLPTVAEFVPGRRAVRSAKPSAGNTG